MTEKEEQLYDKKLIQKEVKRFMKRLTELNPKLKAVIVTDINLKIEEKKKVSKEDKPEIITDKRSFAERIMSL